MDARPDEHQPWQANNADAACVKAYQKRFDRASLEVTRLTALEQRFAPLRLLLFLAMIWAWFQALRQVVEVPLWLLAPALGTVLFVLVLRRHGVIRRELACAQFDKAQFGAGLARLAQAPDPLAMTDAVAPGVVQDPHLASDLDLLGEHSLLARLCRAQTSAGQERLARWMTERAQLAEIQKRQAAVAELESLVDWRHALASACHATGQVSSSRLLQEFQRNPHASPSALRRTQRIVGVMALLCTALLLWAIFSNDAPAYRMSAVVVLMVVGAVVGRWSALPPVPDSDRMSQRLAGLRALARGLEVIEPASFDAAYLQELVQGVKAQQGEGTASALMKRYSDLYAFLLVGRAQILAVLGFLVLWTPYFSLRLERARIEIGAKMPKILEVIGSFEALSSLGCYAYEQPQDCYPEYIPSEQAPRLEIQGLRHPLLPRNEAVRNPVQVGDAGPAIVVISGSNMSGKSTYLRSIGLALVLGRMGTRVPARAMTSSNWRMASHLRSQDSLFEGLSRFGAEVARIAQIVERARAQEPDPFLFLLDEVFSGTNSHDRKIAVDSLVEELIDQRCVGWITTHDLALTLIADKLAPRTDNQHFEDQFDETHMAFDYRLRPGVVQKSNALALMRHAGLLR